MGRNRTLDGPKGLGHSEFRGTSWARNPVAGVARLHSRLPRLSPAPPKTCPHPFGGWVVVKRTKRSQAAGGLSPAGLCQPWHPLHAQGCGEPSWSQLEPAEGTVQGGEETSGGGGSDHKATEQGDAWLVFSSRSTGCTLASCARNMRQQPACCQQLAEVAAALSELFCRRPQRGKATCPAPPANQPQRWDSDGCVRLASGSEQVGPALYRGPDAPVPPSSPETRINPAGLALESSPLPGVSATGSAEKGGWWEGGNPALLVPLNEPGTRVEEVTGRLLACAPLIARSAPHPPLASSVTSLWMPLVGLTSDLRLAEP